MAKYRKTSHRYSEGDLYLGSVEGTNRRGRPLGRRKDRVKEYVSERGVRGKWVGVGKKRVHG